MPIADFLDCSHHQQIINWPLVAKSGIKGVAIKATNGAFQTDNQFIPNASQAKANGLHFGAYHFLLSDADPDAQADNFLNHIAHTGYDLLPTVDVEWDVRKKGETDRWLKVKKDVRAAMVGRFVKRVKDALGVLPLIYTATTFWNPMLGVSSWEDINFADCPLWVAQYTKVLGKLPMGWKSHAIWQFSGNGKWQGFSTPVDLDALNVPIESLLIK
jgi:GH25 family lysozyme M1 (1,4-beta-N-acetylmuramidase)